MMDQHVARERSSEAGTRSLCRLWSAGGHVAWSLAVLATLAGCASLAVRPCDTIEDRDGKYFGRFFLGVTTLGLSEVTIQQEEIRQASQGSPGCPPPGQPVDWSSSTPPNTTCRLCGGCEIASYAAHPAH